MADIEKLIKKKIELEPFELDDDRPRRPPPRDASRAKSASPSREPRDVPRGAARDAPRAPSDPFFDRPYEPQDSWRRRRGTRKPKPPRGPRSPNRRRVKRKVAALLGGSKG